MNEIVKVYKKKNENNPEKEITFGHIRYETDKTFKVHSSNQKFSKKTYYYTKLIELEKDDTDKKL